MNNTTLLERITDRALLAVSRKKLAILSALATGLAAYLFCFVNKLETMDDLAGMYGQGATLSSGRWGLDLLKYLTPNFSLPWLNGLVSLVLITISICLVIEIFEIRSKVLQILLPGLMITFPSQVCTYGYMFTVVQYAIALFLSVGGVFVLTHGRGWGSWLLAGLFFILTMSIYQPFISVAASYLVVYVLFLVLKNEKGSKTVVQTGLRFICVLVLSLVAYYGITLVIQKIQRIGLNEYGGSTLNGIGDVLFGIRVAYTSFLGYFLKGYYDLVPTGLSRVIHVVVALLVLALLIFHLASMPKESERRKKILIVMVCFFLLPPAVNCIRIISTLTHNLMLFGVTCVYVLTAVVIQHTTLPGKEKVQAAAKDLVCLGMVFLIGINVLYANGVYFKMYMQEKQAESFYTAVASGLMQEENYKPGSPVAILGTSDNLFPIPMIDADNLAGIREGIIGTYSQDEFLRTFLGLRLNLCGSDVTDALKEDIRVTAMPSYPYHGCIQELDGIFIVKLG